MSYHNSGYQQMKGKKRERTYSDEIVTPPSQADKEEVKKLFKKKYTFEKPSNESWSIDVLANSGRNEQDANDDDAKRSAKESYKALSDLKIELNGIKDSLSDNDITNWHEHTRFMHTAGEVISVLRNSLQVELCTQAFCKFYEMVCQYSLVPFTEDHFHSVHLCEAPGAFITALNHYLRVNGYGGEWNWMASTLSPYYEGNSHNQMIDDDRFIRGSLDKWYFGEDGTGNLMCEKNVASLEEKTSHLNNILLVTADGSIDCQDAPSDQESLVSRLHYYETLTALRLLKKGGSFVLKVFTMFERESITLMYILNCCFKQVNVIKPGTSKPGNSEVYVVSKDFSGDAKDAINFIQNHLNKTNEENGKLTAPPFPASFLEKHALCCKTFVEYQCKAIQNNLETYQELDKGKQKGMRNYCQNEFINKFKIKRIHRNDMIVYNDRRRNNSTFKTERRYEPITYGSYTGNHYQSYASSSDKKLTGSFNERRKKSNLPWSERVREMETLDFSKDLNKIRCVEQLADDDIDYWRRISEAPIDQIQSSRFIDSKILDCLNEIKGKALIPTISLREKYKSLVEEVSRNYLNDKERNCHISTLYCLDCDVELLTQFAKIARCSIKAVDKDENLSNIVEIKTLFCPIVKEHLSEVDQEVKERFLSTTRFLCKNLQKGDSAILHISTCLTRFSAGLVYILARCFMKTSIKNIPSVNSEQLLHLQDFTDKPDRLDEYLQNAYNELTDGTTTMTLGEILPLDTMISDREFTRFLKETNRNVLVGFINSTIKSEKERFHAERQKQKTEMAAK